MFLVILIVAFILAIVIHYMSDIYNSYLLGFLALILYIVAGISFFLFVIKMAMISNLKNQDIVKNLDTQIYYITGYVESKEDENKGNDYYEILIQEVDKYNKIYTTYKDSCKLFEVVPKEEFVNYQMMIYNYNDNTITWEDGTNIFKGENNNG